LCNPCLPAAPGELKNLTKDIEGLQIHTLKAGEILNT
jgi:hypothetical protein